MLYITLYIASLARAQWCSQPFGAGRKSFKEAPLLFFLELLINKNTAFYIIQYKYVKEQIRIKGI